jgi:hypothetical protein
MADSSHKGVPLRQWASASFDPMSGRAAKSSEAPAARQSADGEVWNNSSQRDAGLTAGENGAPGFGWCDQNRSCRTGRHKGKYE